jgi:hypothetical protein
MVDWSKERLEDMRRFDDLRGLPKDVITKDVVISICEDIIDHFNIPKVRDFYFWKEKDGKNESYYITFGWYNLIGSLLYQTGVQHNGTLSHYHPDAWSIIQSKLPQLSETT